MPLYSPAPENTINPEQGRLSHIRELKSKHYRSHHRIDRGWRKEVDVAIGVVGGEAKRLDNGDSLILYGYNACRRRPCRLEEAKDCLL